MRKLFILLAPLVGAAAVAVGTASAAGSPPKNTALPAISGATQQGQTLTATSGSWSGTQPIRFAFQWRRCDTLGTNCSDIVGATASTYQLVSADVGNTLRVQVTATNADGSTTAVSAVTDVVAGPPARALSLNVTRQLVVYGGSVTLSGRLVNGTTGETVTIMQHTYPKGRTPQASQAAATTTDASGGFSVTVKPSLHTVYVASAGNAKSNPVSILVRPQLRLSHVGHLFRLRVAAARSLVGKDGVLQRWNPATHVWVALRRIVLTQALAGTSPTIVSSASFRLGPAGATWRVLMPLSQTVPGYVSGSSNAI